jgi:hypothetical protein
VPYSFQWTLPPIAVFTRSQDPRSEAQARFIEALQGICEENYAEPRE